MVLTALVVFQLIFDAVVVILLVIGALRRRQTAAAATVAPPWQAEFIGLAQELVAVTEPLLDLLEERERSSRPASAAARAERADDHSTRDRRREALELLRAGVSPDAAAEQAGLLPGEFRLIRKLLDARTRVPGPEQT